LSPEPAGRSERQPEHPVEARLVAMPSDASVVFVAENLPERSLGTPESFDPRDDRGEPIRDRLGLPSARYAPQWLAAVSAASSTAARHSRFTGRIGGIGACSGSAVGAAIEWMFSVREALRMKRL
jgi:hypothetical protein